MSDERKLNCCCGQGRICPTHGPGATGSELAPALGSADPTYDAAYQAFIESMVKHCHCRANNCPCDGVLAGGPCDMVQEEEPERSYDDDE